MVIVRAIFVPFVVSWEGASRPNRRYDLIMEQKPILGELKFEIDSLYVSTEMILSGRFRESPLDGLLLEACLLHFRVVWDFFYRGKQKQTDVVACELVPNWKASDPPPRLRDIRRWLNVMLAHLTTERLDPESKAGEITEEDIRLIRKHTKSLFTAFKELLTKDQRDELVNPLRYKFAGHETPDP